MGIFSFIIHSGSVAGGRDSMLEKAADTDVFA